MENKKTDTKKNFYLAGFILLCLAVVLLIIFLLKGEVSTTGSAPEQLTTTSLKCKMDDYLYPFLDYDNTDKKELEVTAIFEGNQLRSISLLQMLYYSDSYSIERSEAHNHAALNVSFSNNGLDPDSFGASYAKLSDAMKLSLFSAVSKITDDNKAYFLLGDVAAPYELNSVKVNYEEKGFKCEINN